MPYFFDAARSEFLTNSTPYLFASSSIFSNSSRISLQLSQVRVSDMVVFLLLFD